MGKLRLFKQSKKSKLHIGKYIFTMPQDINYRKWLLTKKSIF